LPNLPAIWSLLNGRGVPLLFGFPAYGGGHLRTIRDHDVDPPAWRVPAHLCAGSGRGLAPVGWTTERRV